MQKQTLRMEAQRSQRGGGGPGGILAGGGGVTGHVPGLNLDAGDTGVFPG